MFRKAFTIKFLENMLVMWHISYHWTIIGKLIPPNYLYAKNSLREIRRNGVNYKLDISNVVDHYLYFGYQDLSYNSIIDEIQKSKVILDIGANIGTTMLFFARLNPKAQIIAFEPHPRTYLRAKENLELNDFKNINLLNLGVGIKEEVLRLYEVNDRNPGMNRIIRTNKDIPYLNIDVDALDRVFADMINEKIDFIKIDIEGHEYYALKGGEGVLKKYKPTLFIELDDNNLRENNSSAIGVIALLMSFGYSKIYRADNMEIIDNTTSFENIHIDIIAK